MEIKFDYSKLKGRICEKFNTQSNFAAKFSLCPSSISAKLNNGGEFTQSQILFAAELLDIDVEQIPSYFFTQKVQRM